DFGLLAYDPAFMNTASCKSAITFIDGERGILRYRGYPIDELARNSTYLEVAYLTLFGELPTQQQLDDWWYDVRHHTFVHEHIKKFMDGFHYDAHPMGMFVSTVAALSSFYPEARNVQDAAIRRAQIVRLIAKVPTIAAFAYRHRQGLPYVYPDNDLSFTGNFLNMMFRISETKYRPDPVLERADRKSTRLNSSHVKTSYAVFCLKKKPARSVQEQIGSPPGPARSTHRERGSRNQRSMPLTSWSTHPRVAHSRPSLQCRRGMGAAA